MDRQIVYGFSEKSLKKYDQKIQDTLDEFGSEIKLIPEYITDKKAIISYIKKNPDCDLLVIPEHIGDESWDVTELAAMTSDRKLNVIMITEHEHMGDGFMSGLLTAGVTNAVFQKGNKGIDTSAIAKLISRSRSILEAKEYYGLQTLGDSVSPYLTKEERGYYQRRLDNDIENDYMGDRFAEICSELSPAKTYDFIKNLDSDTKRELARYREFYEVVDILKSHGYVIHAVRPIVYAERTDSVDMIEITSQLNDELVSSMETQPHDNAKNVFSAMDTVYAEDEGNIKEEENSMAKKSKGPHSMDDIWKKAPSSAPNADFNIDIEELDEPSDSDAQDGVDIDDEDADDETSLKGNMADYLTEKDAPKKGPSTVVVAAIIIVLMIVLMLIAIIMMSMGKAKAYAQEQAELQAQEAQVDTTVKDDTVALAADAIGNINIPENSDTAVNEEPAYPTLETVPVQTVGGTPAGEELPSQDINEEPTSSSPSPSVTPSPTAKPSEKPSETPSPSVKPSATPSATPTAAPTPKVTTKTVTVPGKKQVIYSPHATIDTSISYEDNGKYTTSSKGVSDGDVVDGLKVVNYINSRSSGRYFVVQGETRITVKAGKADISMVEAETQYQVNITDGDIYFVSLSEE